MVKKEKEYQNLNYGSDAVFVGRDSETDEIEYRVESGSIVVIEGKTGSGKTEMLNYIIDNFKGKGKVAYLDIKGESDKVAALNFIKENKKRMILLIDNAEEFSTRDNEKIKYYFDNNIAKSVIFTCSNLDSMNISESLNTRIGNNIIKIENLTEEEILRVAEDRIPSEYEISESIVKEIYENTPSIQEFLTSLDNLCTLLDSEDRTKATEKDIEKTKNKENKKWKPGTKNSDSMTTHLALNQTSSTTVSLVMIN